VTTVVENFCSECVLSGVLCISVR